MNRKRRTKLSKLYNQICAVVDNIRDLIVEEQDAIDNTPENIQGSERSAAMDDAIDSMEEACDSLGEAMSSIREIIG